MSRLCPCEASGQTARKLLSRFNDYKSSLENCCQQGRFPRYENIMKNLRTVLHFKHAYIIFCIVRFHKCRNLLYLKTVRFSSQISFSVQKWFWNECNDTRCVISHNILDFKDQNETVVTEIYITTLVMQRFILLLITLEKYFGGLSN